MVSTSRGEVISEGFQCRPGGGSASANGTSIASRRRLPQSLSAGGEDAVIRSQTLQSRPRGF